MKHRFLGTITALMLAVGLAQAQPGWGPPPYPPPYPPPPPPPWAMPPYPPRYYPPPPPPYMPMYPRYAYPQPYPPQGDPARTGEPPVAAAPKETPAPVAEAVPTGPAVSQIFDQDKGPCLRCWLTPEYLYWIASHGTTPPLLTTGSSANPAAGALNQPDTVVLFGGNLNYPGMSGLRLTLGTWVDPDNKFAVEAQGFILEQGAINYSNSSNSAGSPVLTVPYTSPFIGPTSFTISNPNGLGVGVPLLGSVNIAATSRLYGAEFNGYYNLFRYRGLAVDVLGGFRYLGLQEAINMSTNLDDPSTGSVTATSDKFSTNNQFFGGQLGLRGTYQHGAFFVSGVIKGALGVNNQTVDINGSSTVTGGPTPGTFAGGILTQPSNIGTHSQMALSGVPHFQLKVGWEVTPYMRVFAGYDFMFWYNVVRPGNQIDTNINFTQSSIAGGSGALLGPAVPAPMFNHTNYFVQGVSGGIEFRY